MEHLVKHYSELYSIENTVTEETLNAIKCLPVLEELNREPTFDELKEALDCLPPSRHLGKTASLPMSKNAAKECLILSCIKSFLFVGEKGQCQ